MTYRCDREPARDFGTPPAKPPTEAALRIWRERYLPEQEKPQHPADLAMFLKGL